MKVNNYPVKTPEAGDKLFGSNSSGDQYQFNMTNVSNNVFTYEIGEYVEDEGGVIFHRYIDNGVQYYLVIDTTNLSTNSVWSNVVVSIGSTAQSTWDGLSNSNAIVGQAGFIIGSAKLCLDSTNGGQSDWYLPAIQDLNKLWVNMLEVSKGLEIAGGTQLLFGFYWSSTEYNAGMGWGFNFISGTSNYGDKGGGDNVRAVRKFSI